MRKMIGLVLAVVLAFSMIPAFADNATSELQNMYAEAELLMARGDYSGAATQFEALGAYSDASQMAMYCKAIAVAESLGSYDMAIKTFEQLGDFRDSKQMVTYYTARGYEAVADALDLETASKDDLSNGIASYQTAEGYYAELALFKDCMDRFTACQSKRTQLMEAIDERDADAKETSYQQAMAFEEQGKYNDAYRILIDIMPYKDCDEHYKVCAYEVACSTYREQHDYESAAEIFQSIIGYKDSEALLGSCENAISIMNAVDTAVSTDLFPKDMTTAWKTLVDQRENFLLLGNVGIRNNISGAFLTSTFPHHYVTLYTYEDGAIQGQWWYKWTKVSKTASIETYDKQKAFVAEDGLLKEYYGVGRVETYYEVRKIGEGIIALYELDETGNYKYSTYGDMKYPSVELLIKYTADGNTWRVAQDFSYDPMELEKEGKALEKAEKQEALIKASEPTVPPLTEYDDIETVKAVQQALNEAGYNCGTPDGQAGKRTKSAINQYQTDKGLTVTGTVTYETLVSLGIMK